MSEPSRGDPDSELAKYIIWKSDPSQKTVLYPMSPPDIALNKTRLQEMLKLDKTTAEEFFKSIIKAVEPKWAEAVLSMSVKEIEALPETPQVSVGGKKINRKDKLAEIQYSFTPPRSISLMNPDFDKRLERVTCPSCGGEIYWVKTALCSGCNGKGVRMERVRVGTPEEHSEFGICSACQWLGVIMLKFKCSVCKGKGEFDRAKWIGLYNKELEKLNTVIPPLPPGITEKADELNRMIEEVNQKVESWNKKTYYAAIKDKDTKVREKAVEDLKSLGDARAVELLIEAIKDENKFIYPKAVEALGELGDERAVEPLIQALKDKDSLLREKAVEALGWLGDERAVEPLIQALKDKSNFMRWKAAEALGRIGDARAVEPLIPLLKDKDGVVRANAALALGSIGDARAVEPLKQALKDKDKYFRTDVAKALGWLGDAGAVEPLVQALKDKDKNVRTQAREALLKIVEMPKKETISNKNENPNDAEAWFNNGYALHAHGKFNEAVKCYDRALEINPNYAEAWNNKGHALYSLRKRGEAAKCFNRALEINPNYAEKYLSVFILHDYFTGLQLFSIR